MTEHHFFEAPEGLTFTQLRELQEALETLTAEMNLEGHKIIVLPFSSKKDEE